jgi:hypothetical protein
MPLLFTHVYGLIVSAVVVTNVTSIIVINMVVDELLAADQPTGRTSHVETGTVVCDISVVVVVVVGELEHGHYRVVDLLIAGVENVIWEKGATVV